jgi:hypothetical protein
MGSRVVGAPGALWADCAQMIRPCAYDKGATGCAPTIPV